MIKSKYFITTVGISFILGLLPTIIFLVSFGFYPKIPLEIMDDTLFYFGRVREILSGNYFIGNSYLLEHVQDTTTAFFVADWIYSIPFFVFSLFKIPFHYVVIFSEVFWTILSAIMVYILYKILDINDKYLPLLVSFSLLTVLFFILRPVTMSVVYPAFLFFLISFYKWIKNPEGKKESIFLVISSTLSFYVYTYLWQIVLVCLGILFLYYLFNKTNLKNILTVLIWIFVLSIPVFLYTWSQIKNPFYFEALARVGLVNTHTIGGASLLNTLLLLIVFYLLYFFRKRNLISKEVCIFFTIVSSSLLFVSVSNIFSGKDLEIAVHIARFIDLFLSIFISYIFWIRYKNKDNLGKIIFLPIIIIFVYSSFNIYNTYRIVNNSLLSWNKENYLSVFNKINELDSRLVFLSSDGIGSYFPVLTKNYLLFHPNAELYLVSDYEIEERYLVSQVFLNLDKNKLKEDYRKYAGVGNAVHKANVTNRRIKICLLFKKVFDNLKCDNFVDTYSLKGEKYFDGLMERYNVIKNNYIKYFELYSVDYIVWDKNENPEWFIDKKHAKFVFESNNIFLYKVEKS